MYLSKQFVTCRNGAAVLLVSLLGSSGIVSAQQADPRPTVIPPATQLFLSDMYQGLTLDPYLENHRTGFLLLDADADGKITQGDLDLHMQLEASQQRTYAVTLVLSYDLDGDGAVTEDEIRTVFRYNHRLDIGRATIGADGREQALRNEIRTIMALDTDKDGKVTSSEAAKLTQAARGPGVLSGRARQALMLDTSKREITMADYQAAAATLFKQIDTDNDGVISQQELTDYRRRPDTPEGAARIAAAELIQKRQREQNETARKKHEEDNAARAGCAMPKASENARVVVFSVSDTEALSSVALGSQDVVVHAGRVVVEPGSEPLYIVIPTSRATIWQFTGAVERIERLLMSSTTTGANDSNPEKPPLVGATGVAADRLSFFSRSDCVRHFDSSPASASIATAAAVRSATGKEPMLMAKPSISALMVPSGQVGTLRSDRPQPLIIQKSQGSLAIIGDSSNVVIQSGPSRARDELYWYFPGGVIDIDPGKVVANVPVAAYEVLPSEAGLAQLVTSGALTQNNSGEYVVQRKTRLPAGLYGAHSVTFVVRKGAPYPEGDPGHSCVIVEATGASKGAACRSR